MRPCAVALLVVTAYYAGARLGYTFAIPRGIVALWPPSGLMLGLLLSSPRRDWPAIVVGGLIGSVVSDVEAGYSAALALSAAAANGSETLFAAWFVNWRLGQPITLSTLRDVATLMFGAGVVSNAMTALIGMPAAMTETQRRLYNLGVFARVDTAIQDPDGDTDSKYVLYDLEEARRNSVAVGVGAEFARIGGCTYCLDAPAGAPGFSPRFSFAFTRNNLWGLAHSITLRTRVSTLEQQALLTYRWPRFRNNDRLSLSFTGLYDNSKDVRTFSSKREEGSVQLSQRVSKATTFLYSYSYRLVSVNEGTLKITPELIPLLSQPVRLGLLGGALLQDRRDDPVDPHKGVYNTLDLGLAEHIFGSQRDFLRLLARNATYHPLGRKLVLARSTEFGDIYAFRASGSTIDAVPLPERFFGGGSTSNRGFPDEQSGPRDPETGFPIGGTALFFNQTELRFPLIGENIGGVLFHDFGNTFTDLDSFSFRVKQENLKDFDYMVHAVGFGIRYRTPIGPFRVDLAYSLNPPQFFGFKGTEQDLVNAGVNPCANVPNQCTQQSVSKFQFFFSIGQTF